MAVPRQFVVSGDSEVLCLYCLFQSLAVNIRLNDDAFVCDPDVFRLCALNIICSPFPTLGVG